MNKRKTDDTFLRKIVIILIGAIMSGALSGGMLYVKVASNSEAIAGLRQSHDLLIQIKTIVQATAVKLDEVAIMARSTSTEQARRREIVYDSAEHMKDRKAHK